MLTSFQNPFSSSSSYLWLQWFTFFSTMLRHAYSSPTKHYIHLYWITCNWLVFFLNHALFQAICFHPQSFINKLHQCMVYTISFRLLTNMLSNTGPGTGYWGSRSNTLTQLLFSEQVIPFIFAGTWFIRIAPGPVTIVQSLLTCLFSDLLFFIVCPPALIYFLMN